MIQADKEAKRRMRGIVATVSLFLGGTMLVGVAERLGWTSNKASLLAEAESERKSAQRNAEVKVLRNRLQTAGKNEDWNQAIAVIDKAAPDRRSSQLLQEFRAEALFRLGKRNEAYLIFKEVSPQETVLERGDLLALQGANARVSYRRLCEETIGPVADKLSQSVDHVSALEANNTAWLACLAPDGLADYTPALQLSQSAVERAGPDERANHLNTLGAVQYRAGRNKEAIVSLRQAETLQADPFNWAFLALAHARLGNQTEAKTWRDKLTGELTATFGTVRRRQNRMELLAIWAEGSPP
jgi:tetratricopeptide (TPR) repeat protein